MGVPVPLGLRRSADRAADGMRAGVDGAPVTLLALTIADVNPLEAMPMS